MGDIKKNVGWFEMKIPQITYTSKEENLAERKFGGFGDFSWNSAN